MEGGVMAEPEYIGGYEVHPAASIFPLIEGDDFEELVESVIRSGVQHPICVMGKLLIDGRNRLRAVEVARSKGHAIQVPVTQMVDAGQNVSEWIWDTNANRRQMTADGLAMASSAIFPLIEKENEARREASKFDGTKAGPGRGNKTVRTKTCEPFQREFKAEHTRSTVGQVAAKAGTSMHKARQAIAVTKAVASGELPADTAKQVMAGKVKLADVAPKKTSEKKRPAARSMNVILCEIRDLVAEWKNADHNIEVLRGELTVQLERISE